MSDEFTAAVHRANPISVSEEAISGIGAARVPEMSIAFTAKAARRMFERAGLEVDRLQVLSGG